MIKAERLDTSSRNPFFYKNIANDLQKNCPSYRDRLEKELQHEEKISYKEYQEFQNTNYMGELVYQKKLTNGEYEIHIKSKNDSMTFISKNAVDEVEAKKNEAQVSIEFEQNISSSKNKYPFRAKSISLLQIVKIKDQ